jgi:hypothetical protein
MHAYMHTYVHTYIHTWQAKGRSRIQATGKDNILTHSEMSKSQSISNCSQFNDDILRPSELTCVSMSHSASVEVPDNPDNPDTGADSFLTVNEDEESSDSELSGYGDDFSYGDEDELSVVEGAHYIFVDVCNYLSSFNHLLPWQNRDIQSYKFDYRRKPSQKSRTECVNMLLYLIDNNPDARVVLCLDDVSGTFRKKIHPDHQPSSCVLGHDDITKIARVLNVPVVQVKGFEAGDIIATYCVRAVKGKAQVTVVSSDVHMLQLVDEHVTVTSMIKPSDLHEWIVPRCAVSYGCLVFACVRESYLGCHGLCQLSNQTAALFVSNE